MRAVDCSTVVGTLASFAVAPQVNADKLTTLASRNDLTNLAGHRCSSFLPNEAPFRRIANSPAERELSVIQKARLPHPVFSIA